MAPFASLTDRLTLLPLWQKALLAAAAVIVPLVALSYLFLWPLWEKTQTLQADIARERGKLAQLQQTRARITQFKKELAEMDILYRQIQIMLPEAKEIPRLLKTVANLGQQQGLEFLLFKPEPEVARDFMAEIPVTLHLKGTYHQIGIFFDRLRRLPRIVNIKQLELGAFEEKTGKITGRCQLVTFRVLPLAETAPVPTQKPKAGKKH